MRSRLTLAVVLAALGLVGAACHDDDAAATSTTPPTTSPEPPTTSVPTTTSLPDHDVHEMDPADWAAAVLATAGFQDVATGEAAGYASSLDALGCFQDPARGGMGVHYIRQQLLDDHVDVAEPEALVYELDADGHVAGLVAHEHIVPIDAWHGSTPPELFGVPFHEHPTLPLWVLHAWLWKDNPTGVFEDWNPAVRLCPADVPIFGTDLPAPASTASSTPTTSPDEQVEPASGLRLERRIGPH